MTPKVGALGDLLLLSSAGATFVAAQSEDNIAKLGRNDPCHCGSEKKYKKCHLSADAAAHAAEVAVKNAEEAEAAAKAAEAEDTEGADETKGKKAGSFKKGRRVGKPARTTPTQRQVRRRGVS